MAMDYIAYEYKELIVDADRTSLWLDAFENFGWEIDSREGVTNTTIQNHNSKIVSKTVIHLKRNRKIVNKAELTRLQRNFEACMREIDALERSKTAKATAYSIIAGVLGTAFLAGSVMAMTMKEYSIQMMVLSVILAIPGIIGWIVPYFIYRRIVSKQSVRINDLIEQKYDEIYEICEKGSKILQ